MTNTTYREHALANATGSCTLRHFDWNSQQCVADGTENRGVIYVQTTLTNQSGTSPVGPIWPIKPNGQIEIRQQMDSGIPNTTSPTPGGRTVSFGVLGPSFFTFDENIYTTSCPIPPSSAQYQLPVIVVACSPKWGRAQQSDPILRLDPGTTEVWIDPALTPNIKNSIRAALTNGDWNQAQNQVQFVETMIECVADNRHCVKVRPETVNDEVPVGACAASKMIPHPVFPNVVAVSTVYFPSNAESWTADSLRKHMNHELGQHLGINDQFGCATDKSVMSLTVCSSAFFISVTPTATDSLPVTNTVYGGVPAISCPN